MVTCYNFLHYEITLKQINLLMLQTVTLWLNIEWYLVSILNFGPIPYKEIADDHCQ